MQPLKLQTPLFDFVILKSNLKRFIDGLKPHPQHIVSKTLMNKIEFKANILEETSKT